MLLGGGIFARCAPGPLQHSDLHDLVLKFVNLLVKLKSAAKIHTQVFRIGDFVLSERLFEAIEAVASKL